MYRLYAKTWRATRRLSTMSRKVENALSRIVRVDHAGELGALQIYKGQLIVLSRTQPHLIPLIKKMQEQERHHLNTFTTLIAKHRVRPTVLTPIWQQAGIALGVCTALIGPEGAMACTEAVETVIGEHYNNQLREIYSQQGYDLNNPDLANLIEKIKQFRDDELEHLDTALDHDSKQAPAYHILTAVIKQGCHAAIWLSERV